MDATSVKITTSILSMVATFAVGGRFWARKIKKQHYGLDDWTVLASLVVMWALAAVILAGAMIGLYDSHALRQAINSRRQVECSRSRRSIVSPIPPHVTDLFEVQLCQMHPPDSRHRAGQSQRRFPLPSHF
ncbi:hypothetical protein PMIN06_009073 [Paraphaeosphaeria minitans]